jgi:murein DD-endopeptidase MepM/ murein hydrolase activator NlpD
VVITSMDGQHARMAPGIRRAGRPGEAVALFAIDYDEEGPEASLQQRVLLFADDAVGNRRTAPFVHKFIPRPMGQDVIELTDAFLDKVVGPIAATDPTVPGGTPLERYLFINGELRRANNATLVELAKDTAPTQLWSEVFQPFGDAAIKGAFADRRQYRYQGKQVDQQDHLGFDLARTSQSPVNAGNDGRVVLAQPLGIYGNCVVIDHGLGLMTLYAHLSVIDVSKGADVTRGQIIGKTGATGLAGGDHLHFTTVLHGQPCNPIEWWDDHWITDRLRRKLAVAP